MKDFLVLPRLVIENVTPLVDSGLEREFVFQGVVEEGDETNDKAQ